MQVRNKKVFQLTLGGVCLALTIVFMSAASIAPAMKLTLYAVSSLFIAMMIIEAGPKGGWALYAAAVLLGLLLVPNKLGILPYACLFGLYGIVKYYIEKLRTPVGQVVLKLVFFGAMVSLALLLFKGLFLGGIHLPGYPTAALIAGGVIFMMVYDVLYTLVINLYLKRFKKVKEIKLGQ